MINKVVFFIVIILSALYLTVQAEELWKTELIPNARINAMGDSGVAAKYNMSGIFMNSASLSYESYGRMSLYYTTLPGSSHLSYLEYAYPFTPWAAVGAAARVRIKNADNHLQDYYVSMSLRLLSGLSMGVSARALVNTQDGEYAQDSALDASMLLCPYKWLSVGATAKNIKLPEISYEQSGSSETFTKDIQAGLNIDVSGYFNVFADLYIKDYEDKFGQYSQEGVYGIEICPEPSLAFRVGYNDENWRFGMGINSKKIIMDLAVLTDYDDLTYTCQLTNKFSMAPSIKELELKKRQEKIEKDTLYLEGLKFFKMGEISAARKIANDYEKKYGADYKVQQLYADIETWLNTMRKEKMGKAEELKKDILVDFYHGNYEEAVVKLENMKLLAPNYEASVYLEYLLNAGIFLESGEYKSAETNLIEALKIDPDSKEVQDMYNRLKEVIKLSE